MFATVLWVLADGDAPFPNPPESGVGEVLRPVASEPSALTAQALERNRGNTAV